MFLVKSHNPFKSQILVGFSDLRYKLPTLLWRLWTKHNINKTWVWFLFLDCSYSERIFFHFSNISLSMNQLYNSSFTLYCPTVSYNSSPHWISSSSQLYHPPKSSTNYSYTTELCLLTYSADIRSPAVSFFLFFFSNKWLHEKHVIHLHLYASIPDLNHNYDP